jgi:hypothetical protein
MKSIPTQVRALLVTSALALACASQAHAEHVRFDAIIASKADVSLDFADSSQHVVRLVQREGTIKGTGALSEATVLEWGMHDMLFAKGAADGNGYLVVTKSPGDIAYLKFQWRAILANGADGKPVPLMGGHWEVVGSTGALKGLAGFGTMRIDVLKGTERHWMFDGDLMGPQ